MTPIPLPTIVSRLGIVFDELQPQAAANALRLLHVQWFDGAAEGLPKRPPTQLQIVGDDLTALAQLARQYPGRTWTMHLEPNGYAARTPMGKPAAYATRLHDVAKALHAADPTARLLGPEVLDWSTACTGCGGMPTGRAWTEEMRQDYLNAYGQEVPFDHNAPPRRSERAGLMSNDRPVLGANGGSPQPGPPAL